MSARKVLRSLRHTVRSTEFVPVRRSDQWLLVKFREKGKSKFEGAMYIHPECVSPYMIFYRPRPEIGMYCLVEHHGSMRKVLKHLRALSEEVLPV